jgi:glucose/arabinose dehydrogenase
VRLRTVAGVVMALASVAACGGGDEDAAPDRRTTTTGRTTSSTDVSTTVTSTATTTGVPASGAPPVTAAATTTTAARPPGLAQAQVRLTRLATVTQPLAMTRCAGRDTVLVAERTGRVRELRNWRPDDGALLDLSREVSTGGEQGLLGIACSPDGAFLYADYTNRDGDTRVEEFPVVPGGGIDIDRRRVVLAVDQPASNHNGGHLLFGPDRLLWIGLGDGGGSGGEPSQDTDNLLGSILRIDPRPSDGRPYRTPDDNPYARGGGRPEIAVKGVRNPWRFSFDRATGDLWIGDVGASAIEEIDWLPQGRILGANMGWPVFEGTRRNRSGSVPDAIGPVFEYGHDEGQSVVGGHLYRGNAIPALRGAFLFADAYTSRIRAIVVEGSRTVQHRALIDVPGGVLSSFAEGADGEVYVLSLGGGVYRIDPA